MNVTKLAQLSHNRNKTPTFLYLGATLRTFGYSLFGTFGIIYVYQLFIDAGFNETAAFSLVLFREASIYSLKLLLCFPIAALVKRFGAKTLMILGPILSATSMVFFGMAQESLWWLVAGVINAALLVNVYWIPYHTVFSHKNGEGDIGKQMGILSGIGSVLGVISPFISGLIIQDFGGFNVLFSVSFLMFVFSSIAFSYMNLDLDVSDFKISDFPKALEKEKRLVADYFVIGLEGQIQGVIWNIFVFLFIGNFLKLGIISSAISLAMALFTYFIGKLSDDKKIGGLDKAGAVFNGFIWIGKLFASTGLHVFFLDSLFGLFSTTYSVPIDIIVYSDAKHDNPMWPVIVREVALDLGRLTMSIVAGIVIFYGVNYWYIFMFAALGYLLLGFLLKDNRK